MTVKLLTEHHLEILGLKGGCTGSSEPTLVKMSHCRKSHVTAHITYTQRHPLTSHADVSSEIGGLNFGLSLRLSLGMRAVKALASLCLCVDSPEPSVLDNIAVHLFVCLFVLLLYVPSQQLWSLRDCQFI